MVRSAVIIADGDFPRHLVPLKCLEEADFVVCCDGSAGSLLGRGRIPDAIVGDMDSLDHDIMEKYADRIYTETDQETNDLTKAVKWCHRSGFTELTIIGATGKREDHTLGNISLLAEYADYVNVKMITDYGTFLPFMKSLSINTFSGQQLSIFSIDPSAEITSSGLRYPLTGRKLANWWEGTLNEATGSLVEIQITGGRIVIFLTHRDQVAGMP